MPVGAERTPERDARPGTIGDGDRGRPLWIAAAADLLRVPATAADRAGAVQCLPQPLRIAVADWLRVPAAAADRAGAVQCLPQPLRIAVADRLRVPAAAADRAGAVPRSNGSDAERAALPALVPGRGGADAGTRGEARHD